MKQINLSQNKIAKVSDEDFDYLNQFSWYAFFNKGAWYARRNARIDGHAVKISMHREITSAKKNWEVDHINGDGLDNQRSNLRLCSHADNILNTRDRIGKSKYKGVYLENRLHGRPWKAQIGYRKKKISIGRYATEHEAAIAYNNVAKQLHKDFARLNDIAA